jgi:ATP-dependent DNA ligase
VRRDPAGVRLITRNGHDWTGRFPLIAEAAGALRARSFLIDGEAVACDGDGLPLQARLRGHREQTAWFALSVGAVARLAEDEEPERTRSEARGRGGLG